MGVRVSGRRRGDHPELRAHPNPKVLPEISGNAFLPRGVGGLGGLMQFFMSEEADTSRAEEGSRFQNLTPGKESSAS